MNFNFAAPAEIIFGNGTLAQAAPAAARLGTCALVITGKNPERAKALLDGLKKEHLRFELFQVEKEPSVSHIIKAVECGRASQCDLVIGFGGGSVLDSAKAAAALLTNPGDPFDYLEIIGKGKPFTVSPAPCIAIPTTAGTGSEATKNSVIASPEHGVKVSIRDPKILPALAIVDPECTLTLPPAVTAAAGLDALTQLLEAFLSKKANPVTDGFCREGLPRAVRSLRRAVEDGTNRRAREDMALASLFSGLALANAGLGAVHGFCGPVGGMFDAPHGMVCAALLPHTMRVNMTALKARIPGSSALARLEEFGRITGGTTEEEGIDWISKLCRDLGVSSLSAYGVTEKHFPELIKKTLRSSGVKTNPVDLTEEELEKIIFDSTRG